MKKSLAVLVAAGAMVAIMAPTAAFASKGHHGKPPAKGAAAVFGTVCAYTAGSSLTVSQSCGSSSDVTVALNAHTRLTYMGTTSPTPAPVAGDSAAGFLRWHKGKAVVKHLEYSEAAFGFAHKQFAGTYVSSTGDCTTGTLTTAGLGSKKSKVDSTFNTDANTVYLQDDGASTCATVTAGYKVGERVNVSGSELTNASWYAKTVNAQSGNGKGH